METLTKSQMAEFDNIANYQPVFAGKLRFLSVKPMPSGGGYKRMLFGI